ncbi:DUF5363 family protein [Ferrimonas lipolytica]|uniref:DUF5363 family protein n=1 Tax=Ferrimonas lipolytica TaxID=2724191 RepID=A0A6H1UCK4_9GAMM|nr:DUF5363 family protein [Ferrimonas lipolytica]QIZ75936.1 DUF5363 family protein [Ferrimonas lipolytica]
MKWLKQWWQRYCRWVDDNGLNGGQCRSCVPLDERAQIALDKKSQDKLGD